MIDDQLVQPFTLP